jgi:hypothetical protein
MMIKINVKKKVAKRLCPGGFFTDRGSWLCSAYQHPRRGRGFITEVTGV